MGPTLSRPAGWHQAANRHHVQQALVSGEVLTELEVDERGHVLPRTVPWATYWADARAALAGPGTSGGLSSLHQGWRWLAERGFDRDTAIHFCSTYFVLLRDALRAMDAAPTGRATTALSRVLGFATFAVRWAGAADASAAGTWTIHPAYLLARLRQPDAYEDAKFLPLVPARQPDGLSRLFYHYRQFRFPHGRTFSQLSLTDYFQGLAQLLGEPLAGAHDRTWYPLRRFRPESLLLPDGRSILETLCRIARLVVIEDVDLAASDLRLHRQQHGLHGVAATEATDRVRMQSARLFCLAQTQHRSHLPGRPLW